MSNTIVKATKILGTNAMVYTAWETDAGHGTITHIDGIRYGRVGTSRLPVHLESLKPGSDERSIAVRAWHEAEYQRAYAAIVAERPDAVTGIRCMGEIETTIQ